MVFFDYFKKKHKQENSDIKPEIVEESPVIPMKQLTNSMYDGISYEGELLTKVYPQNIQNGTFIVPEHIKSINTFAFSQLRNLYTVIMHDGVRFVHPLAFQGCDNLREIKGLENAETMKTVNGYQDCSNLKSINLEKSFMVL